MSLTYIGAIVSVLAFLSKVTNTELPATPEEISNAFVLIAGLVGFVITLYGRFRKGDINLFGGRK